MQTKYVFGRYDPQENILQLYHPNPMVLNSTSILTEFFKEVTYWIKSCPTKPYLLVNYTNVDISVEMTNQYAEELKKYRPLVLGVVRYGISDSLSGRFTAMAVRMGNMRTAANSNIYPDEASARAALQQLKQSGLTQASQ